MFKANLNRARLDFELEVKTPLLIKAGDPGLDPTAAELSCVRTRHSLLERWGLPFDRTVYIPGSSLKGVLRSTVEATLRTQDPTWACDPLDHKKSCGQHDDREHTTAETHQRQCLACRTFGSLAIKGRAAPRDLFPWPTHLTEVAEYRDNILKANQIEQRHGVAINRISGAVQHGPFELEGVPPGARFYGEIALENYQVWQLGLVLSAFDELNDGFAQMGSAKSRGMGAVAAKVTGIVHEQAARGDDRPLGVAQLDPSLVKPYGFRSGDDGLPVSPGTSRGLSRRYVISGPAILGWVEAAQKVLANTLRGQP